MRHVFVETNWLVDYAAPKYLQTDAALSLITRSRASELTLHVPALCIGEATRTLRTKFRVRKAAVSVREFVRWAVPENVLGEADRPVILRALEVFERAVEQHLDGLESIFATLRKEPNVDIFPLDETSLKLLVDVGFRFTDLAVFDQSVLAAVLGRADELRRRDPYAELSFCELDGDLLPWDRKRVRRDELAQEYERLGIQVYGNFDMELARLNES